MKKLYTSLQSFHRCLQSNKIDYAVIGGLAVAVWGEPRLTQDIDVKVMLSRDEAQRLLNAIEGEYKPFGDNPLEMLKENGILFVQDKHGVRLDIHLSDTLFDMEVIKRASNIEIEPGVVIKVCSAEDLIIYKMLSTRASDSRDFEGVVDYQGDALDDGYIIEWLRQFETALDDSTLVDTYQRKRNIKSETKG
jgi:predicted nucleotidyltransferase